MTENKYQVKIIKRLREMFPGCMILKNDAAYLQGVPDLIVLWKEHWAALEVKLSESASSQPNQGHYIQQLDKMSFAAYIYPENEREVLSALQQAFEPPRRARISQS